MDFRAYNANGTTQDWVTTSNDCWTGRFTLNLPAGNWAVFMDEDMLPTRCYANPVVAGHTSSVCAGLNWNRISPVFTGPGVFTVNIAILETGPWFFRLQKL